MQALHPQLPVDLHKHDVCAADPVPPGPAVPRLLHHFGRGGQDRALWELYTVSFIP
jgi:hypothetical protein